MALASSERAECPMQQQAWRQPTPRLLWRLFEVIPAILLQPAGVSGQGRAGSPHARQEGGIIIGKAGY